MARIRSIHPGFFTDEFLVSASMAARILFIGLGVESDDKGTFEWKPLTLKMRLFPADNVDVESLLAELVAVNAIRKYEMNGRYFGAIRNFRKYQKPKTPNDIHPCTPEIIIYVGITKPVSETKPVEQEPFPPKVEKSIQMEDGGDKMEEIVSSDTVLAFEAWNELAGELGLPKAQRIDKTRKQKLSARLKDLGGMDGWAVMLAKIRGSPFLTGKTDKPFLASLDWILEPKNLTKLMEGNYDERNSANKNGQSPKLTPTERTIIAALHGNQVF